MKLEELKSILFKSASSTMKREGEVKFNNGLVTYFKGKKIDNIYHIYGKVTDKNRINEFSTHIKINLQKKKLESANCSCDEFKEFNSSGYTLICSHITATEYKFFSLLKNDNNKEENSEGKTAEKYKIWGNNHSTRLIRKMEKDSLYYEVQTPSRSEKLILKPEELRKFLKGIEDRKIKFKFDYIEITAPILHKDLPITFNVKEDNGMIVLTTHKQLPISLNSDNDVYYFRNELYLPSRNQIDNYISLHEKLLAHGRITYRKDIDTYTKLMSILSRISSNVNISENLRNYASNLSRPEFFLYEGNGKIYCDIFLRYGNTKINILEERNTSHTFIRDDKKEEKLLMEVEKLSFVKRNNRLVFIGKDEELFNILSEKGETIHSLGNVMLGNGLSNKKIYNSDSIRVDLDEVDGSYNLSYSIGELGTKELNSALEAYKDKNKFYKTRNNNFLDFEDNGVRSFFNLIEVLNINLDSNNEKVTMEKNKALCLYENIKNIGLGIIQNSNELEDIENKLTCINSKHIYIPSDFKGILREYQINGFKWLKTLSEVEFGGILADEMGLGKTIQVIAFLLSEKNKKTCIVCPTSLIYNWKDEFLRFAPSLRVVMVHGSQRDKVMEDICEYDVVLTTYGTLRLDIDNYRDIVFDYCIIDEGQSIKNSEAQNSIAVKEIQAKIRFALTGTPIENNLTELWSIFDFIMPGYLYAKEKFEEKFISRREENLENLKTMIKPFILRRTKKEVMNELPDKIEKTLLVEMTPSQKAVYSNYVKRVKTAMKNNKDGRIEIFSYLTKLREICLDPSLILKDYNGGSGKIEEVAEIIKNHIDSGGKILLFSQFTSALDRIGDRLNKEKIEFFHLSGKTSPKNRIKMVKDFNTNEFVNVFLISLKAGGTGLNLTSANLVIHFDPWWNPAVEAQATDRAHRIGQRDVVEVIKLVSKGTIEEKIILLQEDKKQLIDSILTGELKNSGLLGSLSKEDLQQLFERD
ncbi:DNA helicase [Clostridium beijerinckii]|uniref:DNA helicase n=1 Tax=Clostridium beijerinckii TaxID=1520 RepID=A0A0B5QLK6_CLOBE|nr:SNF2-related protein [Clostridium beijerinckii]AJG97643.1 DNA helicase [Clostridium beijerinckii]